MIGTVIGIVLAALLSALVIYIVGRLNLGMQVRDFGSAFIAAIVIALVAGVINWLLRSLGIEFAGGLLGGVISLSIAAVVLVISDKFVPGMKVDGMGGALLAAFAIGVVSVLINYLLGFLGFR
jgi:putative membrane protein